MNELVFILVLLLPIAWFFGYRFAQRKVNKKTISKQTGFSKTYFAGLNYLLNEDSDKAIDTFVSMLELDSETVEIQLALGNLFRKKGEVERAIRIHQNLIARPSLPSDERKLALLELGFDYMGAGLLDRAENIFLELSSDSAHKETCLAELLLIYQQTHDWEKAIKTAEKFNFPMDKKRSKEISHFYCELAEESVTPKSSKTALGYVKKAFQADPNCVRATLIGAKISHNHKQYKEALKGYKALVKQDIAFLPEALENISDCFYELNDEKGLIVFLYDAISNGSGISSILVLAEIIQKTDGDKGAALFIAEQMQKHPSVKGLLQLIELHIGNASESAMPSLTMLHNVVEKLLVNKPIYNCISCGFGAKTLFWQCPGCKNWGSVKPIQGIEGE